MVYILIGQNVWVKDADREKAKKLLDGFAGKKIKKYLVYEADDPEAYIDDMGCIVRAQGTKYKLVEKVGVKKGK